MNSDTNLFGTGDMYGIEDVNGKIYFICAACMSVRADLLSWSNAHSDRVVLDPKDADNIILLGCQVTDLAVLNDITTISTMISEYGDTKSYYITGCLSRRYDIELPAGVKRLTTLRQDYTFIENFDLVKFSNPFWINDFKETGNDIDPGNLFRKSYPLRIGVGCHKSCRFCTINTTRGRRYQLNDLRKLFNEMDRAHDNKYTVLFVADSPTAKQLTPLISYAITNYIPFSIRNVHPENIYNLRELLITASEMKLLKVFHTPVQSTNYNVLKDMDRPLYMLEYLLLSVMREISSNGTLVATNIITDYKHFRQSFTDIYRSFNYVSWNPYWDGKWDYEQAKKRFEYYISSNPKNEFKSLRDIV
jgi:tRNA A37 methylthiotransferase MiaB